MVVRVGCFVKFICGQTPKCVCFYYMRQNLLDPYWTLSDGQSVRPSLSELRLLQLQPDIVSDCLKCFNLDIVNIVNTSLRSLENFKTLRVFLDPNGDDDGL